MDPQWARDITADCVRLGIPVFGKQWGTYSSNPLVAEQGFSAKDTGYSIHRQTVRAGRYLTENLSASGHAYASRRWSGGSPIRCLFRGDLNE